MRVRVGVPVGGIVSPTGTSGRHAQRRKAPACWRKSSRGSRRFTKRTSLPCDPFEPTWLPDGSGYLKLETPAGASGAEIASYDSASGKRTVVVASEKLLVPTTSQRLRIREFVRSPSGNRFLLHTDITSGERGSDYWLYEPESGALRPVDAGSGVRFDVECLFAGWPAALGFARRGLDRVRHGQRPDDSADQRR